MLRCTAYQPGQQKNTRKRSNMYAKIPSFYFHDSTQCIIIILQAFSHYGISVSAIISLYIVERCGKAIFPTTILCTAMESKRVATNGKRTQRLREKGALGSGMKRIENKWIPEKIL